MVAENHTGSKSKLERGSGWEGERERMEGKERMVESPERKEIHKTNGLTSFCWASPTSASPPGSNVQGGDHKVLHTWPLGDTQDPHREAKGFQ